MDPDRSHTGKSQIRACSARRCRFAETKYTLFRDAFIVGKISSNSSEVGSDGRTRIIRGTFERILRGVLDWLDESSSYSIRRERTVFTILFQWMRKVLLHD